MFPVKKAALSVVFAFTLAGCQSVGTNSAPAAGATQPAAQAAARQPASVDIYQFSNVAIKGYRAVRVNDKQVVYINPQALVNRSQVNLIDVVTDKQNRKLIKLGLNPQGAAQLKTVPKNRGYATVIGGQLASLTGARQGNDFLFSVSNQQMIGSIIEAVVPQAAATPQK